jgi:hypothetical protein
MFCPKCGVEYRPGFTRCTDCDLDLVHELPLAGTKSSESNQDSLPSDSEEDPFCSFWQGDDNRLHAELCTLLEGAGIPHRTVRRQDHLFNLNNHPAFQIGVPFSEFERAETTVKDAYGMDESSPDPVQALNPPTLTPDYSRVVQKLPETLTPPEEENIPGPPDVAEDAGWQSEDKEVVVWSGEDTSLSDMLVASLRENQIDVHRERSFSKQSLLVSSRDEVHAREIVKEVVEGVPPEE